MEAAHRRLALYWGVIPRPLPRPGDGDLLEAAERALTADGLVADGDPIVFVLGSHAAAGVANLVRLSRVGVRSAV